MSQDVQVIDNRALMLRTTTPDAIVEAIPESAILSRVGGVNTIMVNWTLDNVRVLRNFGHAVPTPILGKYHWAGMRAPYAHQKVTSDFLVAHARAFVLNEQGCVDADTEYLTPTGWRRIADYDSGKVGQFDPETNHVTFVEPEAYVKIPCERMIHFKSKYGIDQMLSPEHRVLHYRCDRSKGAVDAPFYRVDSAAKLAGALENKTLSDVYIKPTYTVVGGIGVHLSDAALRVQIAVIADGHFQHNTNRCVVRLKKQRKKDRLRALLDAAAIPYADREDTSATGAGFHAFTFNAPRREKTFTPYYWECDLAQLEIVRDEVIHWDGAERKSEGVAFFSTAKESVDFVQYAFNVAGRVARITADVREGRKTCWGVFVRPNARFIGITNRGGTPDITHVDSTDGFKYCFTVPSTFLVLRRNGCVFVTGNTGKTSSCIWAADYLMQQGVIKRVLVVCPLSVMRAGWQDELFRTVMQRRVGIAHGARSVREKVIASNVEFVIINSDGVKLMAGDIKAANFDLIIVDEFTMFKNSKSARWKALNSVIQPHTKVWMLSGTPSPQGPPDTFGPVKLICPERVPKYFTAWNDLTMRKLSMFKWVPRPDAIATMHRAMQPAIRFEKKDCLDLPPLTYQMLDIELTPQQKKYYDTMRRDMMIATSQVNVTAPNAAAKLIKLLQIAMGAVNTDDDGKVMQFDISNRLAVVREIIEGSSGKVLIAVPYLNALFNLHTELSKDYGCEVVYGNVSEKKRGDIFRRFQTEDDLEILLVQPDATAHGITLTEANTIIWFGPTTKFEVYEQFNARIDRPGQVRKMTVFMMQACPAERQLNKAIMGLKDGHMNLTELYGSILDAI